MGAKNSIKMQALNSLYAKAYQFAPNISHDKIFEFDLQKLCIENLTSE